VNGKVWPQPLPNSYRDEFGRGNPIKELRNFLIEVAVVKASFYFALNEARKDSEVVYITRNRIYRAR
jgi:hypothetical protein